MSSDRIRTLQQAALDARRRGSHQAAADAYLALEALEPDEPLWPKGVAESLEHLGDAAGHLAALERAALRYAERGFVARAIAVYKMILRRDPEHHSAVDRLVTLQARRVTGLDRYRARAPGASRGGALDAALLHAEGAGSAAAPQIADGVYEIPLALASRGAPSPGLELDALASAPMFAHLSPGSLRRVIRSIRLVELAEGEVLYREGAVADAMYVVVDGAIALRAGAPGGPAVAALGPGDALGVVGLWTGEPRPLAAVAQEATRLLELPRGAIDELLVEAPELFEALLDLARQRMLAVLLTCHPLFVRLGASFDELAAGFRLFEVTEGAHLIEAGKVPDHLFVVMTGRVELIDRAADAVAAFGSGSLVGDAAFLARTPAAMSFVARRKAFVLGLPHPDFVAVARAHPTFLAELVRETEAPVWDPAMIS